MNTDDPAIPPTPKRRGPRLATAANVRAFVAGVLRRVELGELDLARARVALYGASILGSLVTASAFEERIRALELREREAAARGEGRLAS
jgi:hypothetical protein